jgi:predicted phosphohydrolase
MDKTKKQRSFIDGGQHAESHLDRRAFIRNGSLVLLAAAANSSIVDARESVSVNCAADQADVVAQARGQVRIGLVTDIHFADKAAGGSRHYRESIGKLREAGKQFKLDKPDFVVELGDLIDSANSLEKEKKHLEQVNEVFTSLPGEKHYVLGNHCVHMLTKAEFLAGVGQKKSYYSFESGGFHFVVLDSCFRSDGTAYGRKNFKWTDPNVPEHELKWLESDLKQAKKKNKKVIVFAHQRLDVENSHGVNNAPDVRKILEASGHVLAVFQGHSHKNDHKLIGGIHYCTLVAMVEGSGEKNNAYSMMDIEAGGTIHITGFRKQDKYEWK